MKAFTFLSLLPVSALAVDMKLVEEEAGSENS